MINKRSFSRPASAGTHRSSRFGAIKRFGNNSRPHFAGKFGGKNKRSRGERIDFSRFIKKGTLVEEKPYTPKYTFADFTFNSQLQKNIARAGFIHPRPIQDQAMRAIME